LSRAVDWARNNGYVIGLGSVLQDNIASNKGAQKIGGVIAEVRVKKVFDHIIKKDEKNRQ